MQSQTIAYFSMEIAVDAAMPTYAGGLGILAGDTLRAAADLGVPMVAITLLHRKGYFTQSFGPNGWQQERPTPWPVQQFLQELSPKVTVKLENRAVYLRAWQREIKGVSGHALPILFLDSDLPENSPWDRSLTDFLYGGDLRYRLCQEIILGRGGIRMLKALDFQRLTRYHMNEGHASLLTIELLDEAARQAGRTTISRGDIETVRRKCIFTTHTPVPAGHDQFPMQLVDHVMEPRQDFVDMKDLFSIDVVKHIFGTSHAFSSFTDVLQSDNMLNLTYLALNLSHYVNGVAKRHGEVSRLMFGGYQIDAITNGVHAATWTSAPFQELFDRYIPGWRADNFSLRYAHSIPLADIREAHRVIKAALLRHVKETCAVDMHQEVLTLGFARRATAYKRADLLLHDIQELRRISAEAGRIQIIYGGKAHPNDEEGKRIIQHILQLKDALKGTINLVYIENYDMSVAKLLVGGVDLWLNTPQPPLEASGTSGMKAALNGVPSLSILDGWWIEGCIEGETGWSFGDPSDPAMPALDRTISDVTALYEKLEHVILPLFYRDSQQFTDVMRHTISLNGSFFNTHRMVQQYVLKAYF